jgi:polyhydroxyalkanoate synthesis regulator phasin
MFEDLKKTFEKGMDFAFQTKDKIEKAALEFAKENNLNKEEAKKLIDHWLKRSEEIRKIVEKQISEMQKAALAKMDLITRDDMKKLEDRIKKLEGYHKAPVKAKVVVKPVKKQVPKKKKPLNK